MNIATNPPAALVWTMVCGEQCLALEVSTGGVVLPARRGGRRAAHGHEPGCGCSRRVVSAGADRERLEQLTGPSPRYGERRWDKEPWTIAEIRLPPEHLFLPRGFTAEDFPPPVAYVNPSAGTGVVYIPKPRMP